MITTGGSYTDITERFMVGSDQWTILDTAKLPNGMEGAAMVSIYNTLYLTGKNEYLHGHNLSRNFDIMKYSNLGGIREGSSVASNEFLKYDINTVNPKWIQEPNSQLSVARFDHAVGVITKDLAYQLCSTTTTGSTV